MDDSKRKMVEYKFLRHTTYHSAPKVRSGLMIYLTLFHVAFIILFGFYAKYETDEGKTKDPGLYAMFMDVHSMMFVGFGFLMTFLKRYGYSSISFNFLVAAFVLEWALLVRGFIDSGKDGFAISVSNLLVADFCAASVLISLGAVLGKTSLTQLIIMATFEVVLQNINEYIGLHIFKAVDVGESIYVHVFGAYFGLAVAKMLHNKDIESNKESSHYHSDLFSMIGTLFLWLYWPSFNSAVAVGLGQNRAIVNTLLSIVASTMTTFIISLLVSRKRLDMVHIQNATLAGGVAVGAIADMYIQPVGALVIGSVAGIISVFGFKFITPALKKIYLHDTCGVHNLHGLPGVFSGLVSAVVAAYSTSAHFGSQQTLEVFYPARANSSIEIEGKTIDVLARTGLGQAGYQLAALAVTLGLAIVGGALTGIIMRLPIIEQVNEEELMFDDETAFITPEDYSLKLTEVKTSREEEEMMNKTTEA